MLDHLGFRVRDLKVSRRFYDATMETLGLQVIDNTATSFLIVRRAAQPIPFLWIGTETPRFWTKGHATSASPVHLAFSADSPTAVQAFHGAGLANGGTDNGPPGPRGGAEMEYYAAYVSIRTATTSKPASGRRTQFQWTTFPCRHRICIFCQRPDAAEGKPMKKLPLAAALLVAPPRFGGPGRHRDGPAGLRHRRWRGFHLRFDKGPGLSLRRQTIYFGSVGKHGLDIGVTGQTLMRGRCWRRPETSMRRACSPASARVPLC